VGHRRTFSREQAAELWELPEMRHALVHRDVALIFRGLQRTGVSQRLIAYLTGQNQSEVSEIICGRHVAAYEVLERICAGLSIPPGHMGMAYDIDTVRLLGPRHYQWRAEHVLNPGSGSRRITRDQSEGFIGGV
jgi:transcriptional regulator with XRE-family HTH domain